MLTVIIVTHLFCCRIHTPVEPSCDVVGLGPVGGAFEVEAMTPRGCRPRGVGPRRECMVSTNTPLLSVYRSAIDERFEVTRPSDELPISHVNPNLVHFFIPDVTRSRLTSSTIDQQFRPNRTARGHVSRTSALDLSRG